MIGRKLAFNDTVLRVTGKTDTHWETMAMADQSEVNIEFEALADAMSNGSAWWIGRSEEDE